MRMSGKGVGLLFAIALLCFLAFALWYQRANPRQIVATGTIIVESRRAGGTTLTLTTRDVRIANTTFREVQMPNGTWLDCAGDCRKAVREATDEFWDVKQPPGPLR
jgi:hypothetical protein